VIGGGTQDIKKASTTYFGFWFAGVDNGQVIGKANTTESAVQEQVLFGGTVNAIRIRLNAAAGAAGTGYTFTLRKNGVDTAVTCSITGTATTCTDTAHSASFSAGDLFSISAVPTVTQPTDNLDLLWYATY
jgi:hypothetical protein